MHKITLALAILGIGCAHVPERFVLGPPSGALDGKAFDVTLKNGKDQHPDRLVFGTGQFHCLASDDDNFSPAAYSIERAGAETAFRSQTTSVTDGTYNWSGTVRGDRIEGTRVWIDKQGNVTRYTFRGQLAPKGHLAAGAAGP